MSQDFLQVGLAFIEGFSLIISPCILPILPIVLSASLTGKRSRPIGIVVGFILMFSLLTLFSRLLVNLLHIDGDILRYAAFILLLLLGLIMMSNRLTELFSQWTQRLTSFGSQWQTVNDSERGFLSGVVFGALIGIVWTPCAGPILAAVIVQVVIQQTTFMSVLIVLAFAVGAGLPMLLIALMGRKIMSGFAFFRTHSTTIRKVLGAVIVLSVAYLAMYEGTSLSLAQKTRATTLPGSTLINGLEHPYPAPEIKKTEAWINSEPLQISQLKGKVILIDFWTYSCINCLRTLPYLKEWYAKYHDLGFEIIGVHSPEFQFEHQLDNVKQAVLNNGITYPVALDNRFMTWLNYHNEYWPAHYLINKEGEVVYEHFGEGQYDTTENNIRYLLGLKGPVAKQTEENETAKLTPETYLGFGRADTFASPEAVQRNFSNNYTFPAALAMNQWALQGSWQIGMERIATAGPDVKIRLHFMARKVFVVFAKNNAETVKVKITLNDQPVAAKDAGKDVKNSEIEVSTNRLYSLLDLDKPTDGYLELTIPAVGLEIYTFTFG